MTVNEIRAKYLEYFKTRGHTIIPSASLVPQNDPTTLFTGSGMQPLVPYLLGQPHPKGVRLTNSQKCFRAEDIEEVGDNRHTTFFEMLGNWSLGDYFKKEQLPWFFEFLTDEIGLDPRNLYVTAFIGDEKNNVPRDTESAEIWQELFARKGIDAKIVAIGSQADGYRLGMRGGRIFYYDAEKNWWSRAGVPQNMPEGEPGGPDSEVFYDFQTAHDPKFGAECHPNCDCGRFLEIGNSVFMQYLKKPDGTFGLLPKQNVDFGGGLERIAAASQNDPDIFGIDVFIDIIALLVRFSRKAYDDSRYTRSFRIIADHMRAATFMIGDGVVPSNTERGYILRRLIRRAAQHVTKLGTGDGNKEDSMLVRVAIIVIEKYKQAYPELSGEKIYEHIVNEIWKEEVQFAHALANGLKELEKSLAVPKRFEDGEPIHLIKPISGKILFNLLTTYGFPAEFSLEEFDNMKKNYAQEPLSEARRLAVLAEFNELMEKHRELSRKGAEQKFKGGLADHSEKTTRLHTAHHLLLKALQIVLGPHVKQRGSNITQERLRIDFSHHSKMTPVQIAEVERIVNEKIAEALPVTRLTVTKDVAEASGAEHEFGARYPDTVSVYVVGSTIPSDPDSILKNAFSKEFCGGPHVSNTRELAGTFKIQKEEAVAAGIRRIKAALV